MEAALTQMPELGQLECLLDLGGPLPSRVLRKPFANLIILEIAAAVSQIAFGSVAAGRSASKFEDDV
jgi:hypothetical protein